MLKGETDHETTEKPASKKRRNDAGRNYGMSASDQYYAGDGSIRFKCGIPHFCPGAEDAICTVYTGYRNDGIENNYPKCEWVCENL